MIGSLLNRGLVLIFGYAYPAYECFKTVEKNKPEVEQLRFWCQYWILVAVLTVCERICDTFIPWFPMYSEAKLAFYIYLWYPKTKGTSYVYDSFFKPYVAKHETEIDRNLMELKTKAGDIVVIYFQKVASYGQTRVFDILQYVAAQSNPTPKPHDNQNPSSQHQTGIEQSLPVALAMSPSPSARRLLSAPANSTSTVKKIAQKSDPESSSQSAVKKASSQPVQESSNQSATVETDSAQIEPVLSRGDKANPAPPPQETVMEEAIHVTRAKDQVRC